ncbi:MAG TPA: hypothetical protein VH593_02315 [Ktedonobacteraceae bacterium]
MEESRQSPETTYVDWREGAEVIGIGRSTFFYHVEKGEIAMLPGTPAKQGRYRLSDILAVKERRGKRRPRKKYTRKETIIIDWSRTRADVLAGLNLAHRLYKEDIPIEEAATYLEWRKNNDKISMAAFIQNREECLAAIQVLPLAESTILDILSGKKEEGDIQPEEIQGYDRAGGYTLLVTNVIADPERPDLISRILHEYIQFWIDMYPERYITKVYAQAVSKSGEIMVQHFFMTPRRDLAPNAFELDFTTMPVASKFVRRKFIDELRKKAPLPAEFYQEDE